MERELKYCRYCTLFHTIGKVQSISIRVKTMQYLQVIKVNEGIKKVRINNDKHI